MDTTQTNKTMEEKQPTITVVIPTTPERREQTMRCVRAVMENSNYPHKILVYENNDGGWVKAVHNALEGVDGYVALLGSDTVPQKDWLKNLAETFFKTFPNGDGVAEPYNEFNHGGALCQHPLAHSRTIKKYLYKQFVHWYSDNDFTEQVMYDGLYVFVPSAVVEHHHFLNKKAKFDETYKTIFNPETTGKDKLLFERRKAERENGIFINNFSEEI